jgi:hypothetical protein
MHCPRCGDEFETGVGACPDCGAELVPAGAPLAPTLARVGRFHPAVAAGVVALAERHGLTTEVVPVDGAVDVLADEDGRDELRAELVVSWGAVLAVVEPDEREAVRTAGRDLPGWHDAPEGGWVDREGRLQVAGGDDAAEGEPRWVGPALVAFGVLLGLLAWYSGSGNLRLLYAVGAAALLLIGLFTPR